MNSEKYIVTHNLCRPGGSHLYTVQTGFGFLTGKNRAGNEHLKIPETNGGFLPSWWHGEGTLTQLRQTNEGVGYSVTPLAAKEMEGRSLGLFFRQDVPSGGSYCLKICFASAKETARALVYTGRRHLAWKGTVSKSGVTVSVTVDVSPIIPRGQVRPVSDPNVSFAILGDVVLRSVQVEEIAARTVYLMGDSTVTDQTAPLPYAPGTSYGGWGQMLGYFLPEEFAVSNHAHSGLTVESFRTEGHWEVMKKLVDPQDICLIQFGHNDQKRAHLQAEGGYRDRLEAFIGELRDMGAIPVLVTPLARNSWTAKGEYNDLLQEYGTAVVRLGKKLKVPVIDLHRYAMEKWIHGGLEQSKKWFYPSDYTHTNDHGAYEMAQFVYTELAGILGFQPAQEDPWEPQPPFSPLMPPEDCQLPAPTGTDPLNIFETERPSEALTRAEALEMVIARMRFFPINVYNDLYGDVVGHETYAGTVQCAAQNGLIPKEFTADGNLYPQKAVTLGDFLSVLMPAYASRRSIGNGDPVSQAIAQGLIGENADLEKILTRAEAARLCRNTHI